MKKIFKLFDWIGAKEVWIIDNMTKIIAGIILFLGTLFIFQQLLWFINWFFKLGIPLGFNYISLVQLLSFSGLVLAFWYSYKKYERDKEIELWKLNQHKNCCLNNIIKNWFQLKRINDKQMLPDGYFEEQEKVYMKEIQSLAYNNSNFDIHTLCIEMTKDEREKYFSPKLEELKTKFKIMSLTEKRFTNYIIIIDAFIEVSNMT